MSHTPSSYICYLNTEEIISLWFQLVFYFPWSIFLSMNVIQKKLLSTFPSVNTFLIPEFLLGIVHFLSFHSQSSLLM